MNPLLLDLPDSFESERLTLRVPCAGAGAEENAAVLESLDDLRPWMPWAKPVSVEDSEARCRRTWADFLMREDLGLHLLLKGTATLVGGSGLHRIDWDVPKFEIGYWVRHGYSGQGYITEAVRAITRFAFETLNANRVEIKMDARNEKSWRVAERAGFPLEAVIRNDQVALDGFLRDTRIYAKIRRPDGTIV